MLLEMVTHCWQYRYSRVLMYQLSSVLMHAPVELKLIFTVFYTREDPNTTEVVEFFTDAFSKSNIEFHPWELPKEKVVSRLIGRNLAALETRADWIWFTDSDYLFGDKSLDSLPVILDAIQSPLVYPRTVLLHESHELGEAAVQNAAGPPRLLPIPNDPYVQKSYSRAIGGVQIVRGEDARRLGYCKDSPRQNHNATDWQATYEDRHFRLQLGTAGTAIELPNIYRLRHGYDSQ